MSEQTTWPLVFSDGIKCDCGDALLELMEFAARPVANRRGGPPPDATGG